MSRAAVRVLSFPLLATVLAATAAYALGRSGSSSASAAAGFLAVVLVACAGAFARRARAAARQLAAENERLRAAESHLHSIFQATPIGIVTSDLEGRVLSANHARAEMLGYEEHELRTMTLSGFSHPALREIDHKRFTELAAGEVDSYRAETLDLGKDGRSKWVNLIVSLVRDAAGEPRFAVAMAEDISDRKRAALDREQLLIQVSEHNERLRELDRLKDDFVASVSHELRTPLTSIQGYLELVLDGVAGELTPEQRRFLGIVDRNSERLLRLVGDLLFVAQVEAGKLTLESADVDLRGLAIETAESLRPRAIERGIDLAVAAEDVGPLQGDPYRLGQLLDNLLSNALKFTPSGGRVVVRCERRGGVATLEIADTGIGIPRAEQGRLFERFFRSSLATERAIQGSGLGLTIAKAIAEAHGGTIEVESDEGVGTTVRVRLPIPNAQVAAA